MLRELASAFVISSICVVIHITGLVALAGWLLKRLPKLEQQFSSRRVTFLLILVFAMIISLHLTAASIWAAFYDLQGLFPDYETSLYFSLGTYTTIGYGDVVLPERWRLLGGIEGISGVLLCGLSTGFIFAIVNAFFKTRLQQETKSEKSSSVATRRR